MKAKIILGVISATLTTSAFGASGMCVKPTTSMVILDPTISPKSYSSNGTLQTWTTTFPYGTVGGIAACYNGGSESSDQVAAAEIQDLISDNGGNRCYCKMTYPVQSKWVFLIAPCGACAHNCASGQGHGMFNLNFRTNMFSTIMSLY